MADVSIQVNCGCGYKTDSLEAAKKHSDANNHKMTLSGIIKPVDLEKIAKVARELSELPLETDRIAALRRKISR